MHYLTDPLKRYVDFSGRTSVKEFWLFMLFYVLILVALLSVDIYFDLWSREIGLGMISGTFAVLTFLPCFAIQVRRLHDTGRSGWWMLIGMVPFIGPVVMLFFCIGDSKPGENQYGLHPETEKLKSLRT